jgi:hypothetical protein
MYRRTAVNIKLKIELGMAEKTTKDWREHLSVRVSELPPIYQTHSLSR